MLFAFAAVVLVVPSKLVDLSEAFEAGLKRDTFFVVVLSGVGAGVLVFDVDELHSVGLLAHF